jgi:hypothetical protein
MGLAYHYGTQLLLCHPSPAPSTTKKWQAGRELNSDLRLRTTPCSSVTPPGPRGTRAGNPTRISSLGPKRHHALDHASKNWKGCRELNSDLKVRSLAPSIRWTTSPIVGRRCRTRTDIQSLEGSVLILLNEAPSYITLVRDAGIEPASSRLKGECIAASANPAKLGG